MLRILRLSHRIVYSESHKNQKNMTKKEYLRRMKLYVLISGKIAARPVNETARLVIDGGQMLYNYARKQYLTMNSYHWPERYVI